MLFNSYHFVLIFLPLTLLGFYAAARWLGHKGALAVLLLASMTFYGYWSLDYLALLLALTLFNYAMGTALGCRAGSRQGRILLTLGIVVDLAVLGYFKYTNFLLDNLSAVTGWSHVTVTVILPLGISFFTFQKIAYLIDSYAGKTREYDLLRFGVFVFFFPQLIAGPIVHHRDFIPPIANGQAYRFHWGRISLGGTLFLLGLVKKVVVADSLALYATPVFAAAQAGDSIGFLPAWGAALAYTLQLYFDFSGYSDMAIGLGRMFGIRLPINFFSPYQARSIIDFWRRWHITLSTFLRDYLYIPLGGNRRGPARRHLNLMLTMLLGGLWHGAGWTFVIWGGLHGLFLMINHGWHRISAHQPLLQRIVAPLAWPLTLLAVTVAWVFFRAESVAAAWAILTGMVGRSGLGAPPGLGQLVWTTLALVIALASPNLQQIMRQVPSSIPAWMKWRPGLPWAVVTAVLAVAALWGMRQISEFLYFQF